MGKIKLQLTTLPRIFIRVTNNINGAIRSIILPVDCWARSLVMFLDDPVDTRPYLLDELEGTLELSPHA